jgi:hypothetical protein
MVTRSISGISGVLDSLMGGESDAPPQKDPTVRPGIEVAAAAPNHRQKAPISRKRSFTRRGRPPGGKLKATAPKEKVTLRVNADLIAEYRDWSWDERCQLGELVERALYAYRDRLRGKNRQRP